MAIIGLLPASGRATRLGGLPKFALPLPGEEAYELGSTLLHYHVTEMQKVCDEVRVCTQAHWAPLVEAMMLPAKIFIRKPTTMTDALVYMGGSAAERYIIGMPDTFIRDGKSPYEALVELHSAVGIAAFECPQNLKGHVGQLELSQDGRLLRAEDKVSTCLFSKMWGALSLTGPAWDALDRGLAHPGLQLNEFVERGWDVRAVVCPGEYVDAGRPEGVARLYE